MDYEIKDSGSCAKQVTVTVPVEEVQKAYEASLKEVRKSAALPGFRKGKAPRRIIESRFQDYLKEQVLETLVPEYFRKILQEAKLDPIGEPQIEKMDFELGKPLHFEARLEFMPDFELSSYKGLDAEKPETSVSEEDIQQALEALQNKVATLDVVEGRPARKGDYLSCDIKSVPVGHPGEKAQENQNILIPLDETLVPDFQDNLKGMKVGEEKTFTAKYPDDHQDKNAAGKSFMTTVTLHALKEKKLPPLDDSFVKLISDEEMSMDGFRKKIRERLAEDKKKQADETYRSNLLTALREKNPIEFPGIFVERQMDAQVQQMAQGMAFQGMDPGKADIPWQDLREKGRSSAKDRVHETLLLNKVMDVEEISVSHEDLNREFLRMAGELKTNVKAVSERYKKDPEAMAQIESRLKRTKTLDFLSANANS